MVFSLALKNIKAKPLRTVATIAVIALSVAMFFCMFAFGDAVYDYIYAVETADAGNSDLKIVGKSNGDRLAFVDPLYDVEGIETIVPTLSLYALVKREGAADEYVRLRGFDADRTEALQKFNVKEGNASDLAANSSNVVISEKAAEHFGLKVGDAISIVSLYSASRTVSFHIAAIAENDGYFLSDSPFTIIGTVDDGIARLLVPGGNPLYNEIYVKVADGADIEQVKKDIAAIDDYKDLKVDYSSDTGYVQTQADGIAAPITISGIAVALLCVVSVVLIFVLGIADKRAYAAKLALIGATRRQLLGIFLVESAVLAFAGAVLGAILASGVFVLLLQVVLSSVVSFSVNGLLLFGATVLGFAVAFVAALYPLYKVFSSTARENLLAVSKKSSAGLVVAAIATALTVACFVAAEFAPAASGALSVVALITLVATVAAWIPYVVRGAAKLMTKSSSPQVKVAGYAVCREKRATRTSQTFVVGVLVVMLLFMAWSLTTSIFSDFTAEFENMILVTNVPSSVETEDFKKVDGVESATLMVWRQAEIQGEGMDLHTVNMLGSADALDLIDFEYITPRDTVEKRLAEGGYVILDYSVSDLYGVKEGDEVSLIVDGEQKTYIVGGIVQHAFFGGRYVIISRDTLEQDFGVAADTVVLSVSGNVSEVAENVRSVFADNNYYAVPAIEAYKWDTQSLDNIFDLIGTLAFVLALLVYIVALSGVVVGRSHSERTRGTLLCAGMSQNMLLGSEIWEHAIVALCVFAVALPASALATLALIGAIKLFGLYYAFTYQAWVVVVAGLVVSLLYVAIPLMYGFKRKYGMRRS